MVDHILCLWGEGSCTKVEDPRILEADRTQRWVVDQNLLEVDHNREGVRNFQEEGLGWGLVAMEVWDRHPGNLVVGVHDCAMVEGVRQIAGEDHEEVALGTEVVLL